MKKLLLGLLIGIGIALGITALGAAVITPQFGGGTSTSTVFGLNSLILQGSSSYKGVATGSVGSVLSMSGNVPTWVATSTLGIVGSGSGSVTSVDMTVPTGLAISGNPITTSGTLALSLGAGYNIPLTASTTNWNSFFDFPLKRIGIASSTNGSGISVSTTSPNTITLNIPTASASITGQLSSTDWSTFNGKQNALTLPLTVANGGTATSTTATSNGQFLGWNNATYGPWIFVPGSNVTITTTTPGQVTIGLTGVQTSAPTILGGGTATGPAFTFASTSDTNLLLSVACATATCTFNPSFTGTLAAARLNSNVVQAFTNDTNVTATISAQNATLAWSGVLSVARGGTATSTAPTTAGQILMADGTGVKYQPGNLVAGTNITLTTSTPGQITIAAAGGGGLSGGSAGFGPYWTSASTLGVGKLMDNGSVLGVNATSTSYMFNLQATAGVDPLNIASSSGASVFQVKNSTQSILSIGTTSTASNLIVQGNSLFPTESLFTLSSSSGSTLLQVTSAGSTLMPQDASSTLTSTPALQLGSTALSSPSANGTFLGINALSTFTGNFLDFQLNGTSKFKVSSAGALTLGTALTLANGGTGGTTAATAKSNLGVKTIIGPWTDNNLTTASASTYRVGVSNFNTSAGGTPDTRNELVMPFDCTVNGMYVRQDTRSTLATYTSGSTSWTLEINGAAGNNVVSSSTVFTSATAATLSDTSHTDVVHAGDALRIKFITGTLSVPPTGVDMDITLSCLQDQ